MKQRGWRALEPRTTLGPLLGDLAKGVGVVHSNLFAAARKEHGALAAAVNLFYSSKRAWLGLGLGLGCVCVCACV